MNHSLLETMQQLSFYPHPGVEPITLLQTHISLVFLTGEYAYKVKKAVDLGFLDYSTLEKRRHFCEEELRRNRLGAEDLYLEVVAIGRIGDRFCMGAGEVVEYAVKMRQFPQRSLFVNRFDRGELSTIDLEELGRVVATYHGRTPTSDYISGFGTVDRVIESVNDNYQHTERFIGTLQARSQFEETKRFTDEFSHRHCHEFDRRISQSKIRECHGDLHLKNIAFWNENIILFDCIEFSEPLQFVDTMYDVAFTVMDLEARERQDLANAFLNTYLERTADWEGGQLLPFYLCRQAYVRAKVYSLMTEDKTISLAEKEVAIVKAKHYYRLAWNYAQLRRGRLFLMSGLSGSGKTTIAKQLSHQIGAIHIRSDAVRKHLAGIRLDDRAENIYTDEMTQRTYDRLIELGKMLALQGWSVILDAKFDRICFREKAIAMARANRIGIEILHCTAPVEILRDRLNNRIGDIADATADLLAMQQEKAEPFGEGELPYVRTIDTTGNIDRQLAILDPTFR